MAQIPFFRISGVQPPWTVHSQHLGIHPVLLRTTQLRGKAVGLSSAEIRGVSDGATVRDTVRTRILCKRLDREGLRPFGPIYGPPPCGPNLPFTVNSGEQRRLMEGYECPPLHLRFPLRLRPPVLSIFSACSANLQRDAGAVDSDMDPDPESLALGELSAASRHFSYLS